MTELRDKAPNGRAGACPIAAPDIHIAAVAIDLVAATMTMTLSDGSSLGPIRIPEMADQLDWGAAVAAPIPA